MSRPGQSTQRNLTLTEELEKLEQSITLTLQEIDSNFSKAHRIVTTSILPLVEQYGEHSRAVWEATKFWKQFFEASANVSLSGYEDLADDNNNNNTTGVTAEEESTVQDETSSAVADDTLHGGGGHDASVAPGADESSAVAYPPDDSRPPAEESMLDDNDGDVTGSTPRPPANKTLSLRPKYDDYNNSPYVGSSNIKREQPDSTTADPTTTQNQADDDDDTSLLFQQHTARLPDVSFTPRAFETSGLFASRDNNKKDPLLHRLQDKTYRIAATPHKGTTGVSPMRWKVDKLATTPGKEEQKSSRPIWQDSPASSPEMAPPQLRSAAFMSPMRAAYNKGRLTAAAAAAPRTPGVSVQTPATGRGKVRDVFASGNSAAAAAGGGGGKAGTSGKVSSRYDDEITWESDEDEDGLGGLSPPKTIQFALPPSKLLQTPGKFFFYLPSFYLLWLVLGRRVLTEFGFVAAREASKRIVDNILLTAGEDLDEMDEYSPTMVKMKQDILDDTF
jgi:DASH complex subunit ASK1